MKSLSGNVNSENLEDLLTYDDLFLDYFNEFLSSPSFPQKIAYHPLINGFQWIDSYDSSSLVDCNDVSQPLYGTTDDERERMMNWAREERLPLFMKTELYRELKLCKRLLRAVVPRGKSSSSGAPDGLKRSHVGGYSRQTTTSYITSGLTISGYDDENDSNYDEENYDDAEDYIDDDEEGIKAEETVDDDYYLNNENEVEDNQSNNSSTIKFDSTSEKKKRPKFANTSSSKIEETSTEDADTSILPQIGDGDGNLDDWKTQLETSEEQENYIPYDRYARPGSGALSLPGELTRVHPHRSETQKEGGGRSKDGLSGRQKSGKVDSFIKEDSSVYYASTFPMEAFLRSNSVPISHLDYLRLSLYGGMDDMEAMTYEAGEGGKYLDGDGNQFDQPGFEVMDVEAIERRQRLPFQRLKEILIGSRKGMQEFMEFLSKTIGIHLYRFWLDCEDCKDQLYLYSAGEEGVQARIKILRELQDKYKLRLTSDARRRIREATSKPDQTTGILIGIQYDTLRRLRAYWLPRFILHKERQVASQTMEDLKATWLWNQSAAANRPNGGRQSDCSGLSILFPSISYAQSMPVRPDISKQLAETDGWETLKHAGRNIDSRLHSPRTLKSMNKSFNMREYQTLLYDNSTGNTRIDLVGNTPASATTRKAIAQGSLVQRMRLALALDRTSGEPFASFLKKAQMDLRTQYTLQFYKDVEEFTRSQTQTSDRYFRLNQAWAICNRYLLLGSTYYFGLPTEVSKEIQSTIKCSNDTVNGSVFFKAQDFSCSILQSHWLRFLKQDVKKFMECSLSHRDSKGPPQTLEEIEVTVEGERIIVRRKSTATVLPERQTSWDLLSPDEKAERRRKAEERLKEMEKERRRAVKAAMKRVKEAQQIAKIKTKPQAVPSRSMTEVEHQDMSVRDDVGRKEKEISGTEIKEEAPPEKPPELKEMTNNKAIMALFGKYLEDHGGGRDTVNQLALFKEILNYQGMTIAHKKDVMATYIYRTFLDKNSKRHIHIASDRVQQRLAYEKERPKTPTMKDMQNYLFNKLQELFQNFWMHQSEEMGIDMFALKNMSEKELMMRAETNAGLRGNEKTRQKKETGKAQPSKTDKTEFVMELEECTHGPLTLKMLYFYNYLVKYAQLENNPTLDKNLFFYVEVAKFKTLAKGQADDKFLRKKVQCISGTFLESPFPPAVQIMVGSEISQNAVRSVQRYTTAKEMATTLFDEAQFACFKTLLPYWAGFLRYIDREPLQTSYRPSSVRQKMMSDRLDLFSNQVPPNPKYPLPHPPKQAQISALTFTITEGLKWKADQAPRNPGAPPKGKVRL